MKMTKSFEFDGGLESDRIKALQVQHARDLSELNHRIANSLAITASFLTLQRKRLGDGDAKDALAAASARVTAVSKLHRYLYVYISGSKIDLQSFLGDLCPDIAVSTGLSCSVAVEPIEVSDEMAQQLAIIINEFAINARKHAYDGKEGGALKIEGRRDSNGRLRLSVADGGAGLPDGFDPAKTEGLGLSIVSKMVKQLGAELIAENDQGARFTLLVPLPESNRSDAHIPSQERHKSHPPSSPAPDDPSPAAIPGSSGSIPRPPAGAAPLSPQACAHPA